MIGLCSSIPCSWGARFGAILVLLLALATMRTAQSQGSWYTGRATNYGAPGDPWSIDTGACNYGYLDWHKASGWDVAAMADADNGYSWPSVCGLCYEVACQNMGFKDGYGQWLDRTNACYDTSASVIVQIVDHCPCVYPPNAYSNKRWCCGDMWHLDLSVWAFEKLAETKWGVIGLKVRWVPCGYKPANPAKPISNPTVSSTPVPKGWTASMDKRPWPTSQGENN